MKKSRMKCDIEAHNLIEAKRRLEGAYAITSYVDIRLLARQHERSRERESGYADYSSFSCEAMRAITSIRAGR